MSNYLGNKCMVCGQRFDENDDVVVCPDCGTPYHRDCYIKEGRCINEKLHESGKGWEPEPDNDGEGYKKCESCGNVNKPHTIICENCGSPMLEELNENLQDDSIGGFEASSMGFGFDPMDKYCGINPEEEFEDVRLKHLADFVGTNQVYYLPMFKKMKDTGKKISLNIVSMFAPQLYFANRKMWLWTILTIIIVTILNLPMLIYNLMEMRNMAEYAELFEAAGFTGDFLEKFSRSAMLALYDKLSYVDIAFRVVLMLFSNWLYYRHCIKKINLNKDENGEVSSEVLSEAGGTSIGAMLIGLVVQFAITAIVMTVLLI